MPKKKAASKKTDVDGAETRPVDFESALQRLEEIVLHLEQGDIGLSDSLKQYEEGIACLRQCQEALTDAEIKIEQLFRIDEHGQGHVKPFEHEGKGG